MVYQATVSTPLNTLKNSPARTVLKVTKGLVYKVEFHFPSGSLGLLHVYVCDGLHKVWPTSVQESFAADNALLMFDDTYLKLTPPFQFDIYTWNECQCYAHTVVVRVGLVSKEIFIARFLPGYGERKAERLLQAELQRQEAEKQDALKQPFSWIPPKGETTGG